LVIFNSKIVIDAVTSIPLVPLPPATITIPDGPRPGESREIPYNEIPLFGRLTIHDQLEPHQTQPGKHNIALNFSVQDAPVLVATPLREEYATRLFGPHIECRSDGDTAVSGQDPRISWELDYAEAHWITHSIAGELMVGLERLQHPSLSDGEAIGAASRVPHLPPVGSVVLGTVLFRLSRAMYLTFGVLGDVPGSNPPWPAAASAATMMKSLMSLLIW
jgi:hypothetical protein